MTPSRAARHGGSPGGARPATPVPTRRLRLLLTVTCTAFAVVAVRVTQLQVVSPARYQQLGIDQRTRVVKLAGMRGALLDRNGRELALSKDQPSIWADPAQVTDPLGAARALSAVLGIDEDTLADRLSRAGRFVWLARQVDDDVAARVRDLRLAGVQELPEPRRFLPGGDLARPVLGTVGTDGSGLGGLELQYQRGLSGSPGELVAEFDPAGNSIPMGSRTIRPARPGDDLVLTIDRSLQFETERVLAEQITTSKAIGGMAVVMDPRTGEVLAMANLRAQEPGGQPAPSPANDALVRVYEPGSTNKVITMSAAIEENVVEPTDVLTVPDRLRVADHVFSDSEDHPTEQMSVTEIFARSSNVGTIQIAQRLGKNSLDRYLRRFGLGTKTGLGFPGESAGLLLDPDRWSGTSIGTVPIGQGLAVTAVQMLQVVNTIANGGVWTEPSIVKATIDETGQTRPRPRPTERRVVSPPTARVLTTMLEEVVRSGTGTAAAIDGYRIAGKTGTARKPKEGARGYTDRYIATFAGFAPAEAPRLSLIVALDEPTPIYGGLVSAPAFAKIAAYGLRLLGVPPSVAPRSSSAFVAEPRP